jgi:hypothetical protein
VEQWGASGAIKVATRRWAADNGPVATHAGGRRMGAVSALKHERMGRLMGGVLATVLGDDGLNLIRIPIQTNSNHFKI